MRMILKHLCVHTEVVEEVLADANHCHQANGMADDSVYDKGEIRCTEIAGSGGRQRHLYYRC